MTKTSLIGTASGLLLALSAAPGCSDDMDDAMTGGTGAGPASGGAPATGGADASGGSGAAPATDPEAQFVEGGLGTVGDWSGYLWTAGSAGTTIMPAEFTGETICANGSVGAGYEEWAMVGWNLNQEIDEETGMGSDTLGTVTPTGSSLTVNVDNRSTGQLRVQIQTSDADDATRWCAAIPSGGVINWTDFNTKCWDGSGEDYDGSTPIAQMAIQAPAASDTEETAFDFCWVDVSFQ